MIFTKISYFFFFLNSDEREFCVLKFVSSGFMRYLCLVLMYHILFLGLESFILDVFYVMLCVLVFYNIWNEL